MPYEILELGTNALEQGIYVHRDSMARVMTVGSDWTKLNVGIRIRLHHKAATAGPLLIPGARFWFGVCSGTTNFLGKEVPDHFHGICTSNATWAQDGTDAAVYHTGRAVIQIESGTQTVRYGALGDAQTTGRIVLTEQATDHQWLPWYAQFEKKSGGTLMGVTLVYPTTSDSGDGVTKANFLYHLSLSALSTSAPGHTGYGTATASDYALDEGTHGDLDSLNLMVNLFDDGPNDTGGLVLDYIKAVKIT